MTRTSAELELEFLNDLEVKTGKNLAEWMRLLHSTNHRSRRELLEFMMTEHAWSHLRAQLLIGIFLNDGKPVYLRN